MIVFRDRLGLNSWDEYVAPLDRLRPYLADRGILFDRDRGDIAFADGHTVTGRDPDGGPEPRGEPTVLFDRDDGAFLWWLFGPRGDLARRWLRSDRVLGLVKISRYRDPAVYDDPADDERLHVREVHRSCPDPLAPLASPPRPTLGESGYDKIRLGHGFWAFDVCGPQAEPLDLDAPRPLDLFCSLTVDYACPAITWHRRQALAQVCALGRRSFVSRGRVLPGGAYHALMRRSRICVSPWGWGETCHRDYEALLAGCVLIKPKTDFIDSLLPLDERHYVACLPDFSDLHDRVDEVLQSWPSFRERRAQAREYVLNARCPEWLADRWAAALKAAVAAHA